MTAGAPRRPIRWQRPVWALLLVLALSVLAAAIYVQRSLPQLDGRIRLDGLRAPVDIERDADGVPTIRAASIDDALFGLGFAHAQDRLWQLETHRRIAAGRLAEAFGPTLVDTDRFLRVLGLRRAAQAQWEQVGGDARSAVQSYTAGINAWLRDGLRARPPEFVLLGIDPEPWEPVDTMAWLLTMAWDLGGNWSNELLRLRLALRLPSARVGEVMPASPGDTLPSLNGYAQQLAEWQIGTAGPPSRAGDGVPSTAVAVADEGAGFSALDATLAALEAVAPPSGLEGLGSNNWVVSGAHTRSGAPMLANDPHLRLSTPSLWYIARLEAPGLQVAGATMPGVPAVVLGQNARIAWGFTNTAADVQDLYFERLDPDDPTRYRTPDGWAPFEVHRETIRVRGGADVPISVRRTRHGPVLSDAVGIADGLLGIAEPGGTGASGSRSGAAARHVLSLRWLALDPDPGTLVAGLAMQRAGSVDAFIASTQGYVAPMQNMVVADVDGHIGFVAAGRAPRRRSDNEWQGTVPAPGWTSRYDWDSPVDPAATPRAVDPARGWIVTANQRLEPPPGAAPLTHDWALPYRHERIEALLAARAPHDPESFAAMQADQQSQAALRLWPHLVRAQPSHRLAAAAAEALAGFDGRIAADRAAPLIYWAWVRRLSQAVFEPRLGESLFRRMLTTRGLRDALEGVLERDDAWWCDDPSTAAVESCAERSAAALAQALDDLAAAYGDDVSRWRWDAVHRARLEHRPFSRVPVLARAFERQVAVGGDTYTVDATRVALRWGDLAEAFGTEHGPSLRAIYELGDPSQSRLMIAGGASGLPYGPGSRSDVEAWAAHTYRPLWPSHPPANVLRLEPPPR